MGTQRTTFAKLQRERAKKAKAAAKRERRHARTSGDSEEALSTDDGSGVATTTQEPVEKLSSAELLELIEALHKRFDDKLIDFEDFEEEKAELLDRLARMPIE